MKINKWVKNMIYVFLIIILFCGGMIISSSIIRYGQTMFDINISLVCLTYFIFYGGIGVILGLDNFIKELKKDGKWKLDIPRLIVFGLPCIIFSIPHVQYFLMLAGMEFIDSIRMDSIHLVSSIILGYTLISSVVKEDEVI